MKRKIELYGRLRDAGFGSAVSVDVPENGTARQALAVLKSTFGAKASLLQGCALATDEEVLAAGDALPSGRLALLPPVCGG